MKIQLKQQIKTALFTACLIAPMSSMAAVWGTGASSNTSACASFSATCSTGTSGNFGPYIDNVEGASTSSSISDSRGAAEAHATMINESGIEMIHLKGQAASNTDGIAKASSWGLNTYTYAGASTTITLDINLTGMLSNPGSAFTNIEADVYIINPNDLFGMPFTNISAFFGEGVFPITQTSVSIGDALTTSATDSLSITLNDGDEFAVWALLYIGGGNGGQVQAMNSLDLTFSNNTGLSSPASVVPVPAAIWLFASGLLGLVGIARRKNA